MKVGFLDLLNQNLPLLINLYSQLYVQALNGCLPYAKANTTTPYDQTSTFYPKYSFLLIISGAIQFGVPQMAFNFIFLCTTLRMQIPRQLNPKSMSLTCQSLMSIFCSLISLWTMFFQCMQLIALISCRLISLSLYSSNGQFCFKQSRRDWSPPYQTTIDILVKVSALSIYLTIPSCWRFCMMLISFLIFLNLEGSLLILNFQQTLIATNSYYFLCATFIYFQRLTILDSFVSAHQVYSFDIYVQLIVVWSFFLFFAKCTTLKVPLPNSFKIQYLLRQLFESQLFTQFVRKLMLVRRQICVLEESGRIIVFVSGFVEKNVLLNGAVLSMFLVSIDETLTILSFLKKEWFVVMNFLSGDAIEFLSGDAFAGTLAKTAFWCEQKSICFLPITVGEMLLFVIIEDCLVYRNLKYVFLRF